MMKFSKALQCIAISGLLLITGAEKSLAFLPIPPMPGQPVVDGLNIPNKVVSTVYNEYNKIQAMYTALKAGNLSALKGPVLGYINQVKNYKNKKGSKVPGTKEFGAFNANGVTVDEGSVDENQYRDMYHALFFTYPSEGSGGDNKYEVLKTAYKHKTDEYIQDVIVDTYIKGRYTEDYLVAVEATLSRLEACVLGDKEGNDCIFFGMQVEKPSAPEKENSEPEEGDTGHIGAVRNAYIVSSIYDRLLRIVEDLTATEAVFRAAQQIKVAKPVSTSENKESSAAKYLDNGMRFVYNSYHDNVYAVAVLNNNKISERCKSGVKKEGCPEVNTQKITLKSVADTAILQDLQKLDNQVAEAREIHNMKSRMNEYKTMYLQYLTLKKIHDKALAALEASDTCVVNFLDRHLSESKNASEIWYGTKESANKFQRNEYNERQGLSGWLIKQYNEKSAQITIGEGEGECAGYYEICPAGYTVVEDSACEASNGTTYHECYKKVETVTIDSEDAATKAASETDLNELASSRKDTDGFMDGSDSEKVLNENRQEAELTWNIGRDGVMKFMEEGGEFKLWSDQKVFQAEYLRNKYRNMRLIIDTADMGMLSYNIGSAKASKTTISEDLSQIRAIAQCQSLAKSVDSARQKHCFGQGEDRCKVTAENGNIITRVYNAQNDNWEMVAKESQKVSVNNSLCTYKNPVLTDEIIKEKLNNRGYCFTPACLVRNFYPKVLGKDAETFANQKGRTVAADILADVIITRNDKEAELKDWIRSQVEAIDADKQKVTNQKHALKEINEKIDEARKKKNDYKKARDESESRLVSIDNEREQLTKREEYLRQVSEDKKVPEADKDSLAQKRKNLTKEEQCIKGEVSDCTAYVYQALDAKDTQNKYMRLSDAEKGVYNEDAKIKAYEARLDAFKDQIAVLEGEIETKTDEFAKNYLVKVSAVRNDIEKSNDEFENFLEDKDGAPRSNRMLDSNHQECLVELPFGLGCKEAGEGARRLETENVACTLTNVMHDNNGNGCKDNSLKETALKNTVKQELEEKFFANANMRSVLESLGISGDYYIAENFLNGISGKISAVELAKAIKDKLIEIAAVEIGGIITDSDMAAKEEITEAKNEIKSFTDKYKLSGASEEQPTNDIYNQAKYESIREGHLKLIEDLRKPSNDMTIAAGIKDLSDMFGIPAMENMKTMSGENTANNENVSDTEYFVGLPARGYTYKIKNKDGHYEYGRRDDNAGRDFLPPMSPMTGLPPLREVFYFSAIDYDEIPQQDGKPVLSHLLGCKYSDNKGNCIQEYLPEIWLHLLASPNLRNDGKYQQTFVERSFAKEEINNLVRNQIANMKIVGARTEDYRSIIGRSGVYPCKSRNTIIDIEGGDNVIDVKFMRRNSAPKGINLQNCQEVSTSTGNICKTPSGKLCHLLADHDKDDVSDNENLSGLSIAPMYENYSELGQLLTVDLKYHPLQRSIQEYLKENDENKLKNDINRQKAERASFKRNAMGAFLDTVIAEDKANKALKQNEKDMKDSFETLCAQLNKLDIMVDDCVNSLMAADLKDLSDDDIKCSSEKNVYEQIFCALDNKKNDKMAKIKSDKHNLESSSAYKDYKDKLIVKERMDNINTTYNSLVTDKNEDVIIRPEQVVDDETVRNANIDKKAVQERLKEGLKSMENQSQSVAYCPIY